MDSRWRNLLLVFVLIVVGWLAWQWLQTSSLGAQTKSEPTPPASIDSFENGRAATMAILQSVPGFDYPTGSFVQTDRVSLEAARNELNQLYALVQRGPNFDEKPALVSFLETWLRRVELELSWNALQEQSNITFSGSETQNQVCAQKSLFESTRVRLETARLALEASTRTQTNFLTGFSTIAIKNGFENAADIEEELFGLQHQIQLVDEILEACA